MRLFTTDRDARWVEQVTMHLPTAIRVEHEGVFVTIRVAGLAGPESVMVQVDPTGVDWHFALDFDEIAANDHQARLVVRSPSAQKEIP